MPVATADGYINANFVRGPTPARAYIAAMAPLPATLDAFWRMIWDQVRVCAAFFLTLHVLLSSPP